jgi:hypothetical protein
MLLPLTMDQGNLNKEQVLELKLNHDVGVTCHLDLSQT